MIVCLFVCVRPVIDCWPVHSQLNIFCYLYLCLPRFTLSTGYFGLSLNTSRLHANPYISCFISAAVEVPAYISSWLALRYLPRRLSVICILLLAGVSLYFIQLVPQSKHKKCSKLEVGFVKCQNKQQLWYITSQPFESFDIKWSICLYKLNTWYVLYKKTTDKLVPISIKCASHLCLLFFLSKPSQRQCHDVVHHGTVLLPQLLCLKKS